MKKKRKSKLEIYVEKSIIYLIIILVVLLLIELFVPLTETQLLIFEIINLIIILVFAVDLYFLYIRASDWKYFLKHHWSDIIAIIPVVTIIHVLISPEKEVTGGPMLLSLFKILRVERFLRIGLIERILESLKKTSLYFLFYLQYVSIYF